MKSILFLICTTVILSCNQNPKTNQAESSGAKSENPSRENFEWLTGNWKRINEKEGKETFENWNKISSTEYSGIGFTLQKGDTISQEKMDLMEKEGKWKLYVKAKGEKTPIAFTMSEFKANEFICVNDSIDFPKKIHYLSEGGKLKAKISNDTMEIPFEFEKMQ